MQCLVIDTEQRFMKREPEKFIIDEVKKIVTSRRLQKTECRRTSRLN